MIWTPKNDLIVPPSKELLFRIRKYRDRVIDRLFVGSFGIGGFYRLEVQEADGRCHWLTDWFHNHIPDAGLNLCATTATRYAACQVGTGNDEPTDADTTLKTFLAGTTNRVFMAQTGNTSSEPYWFESYYRYDFNTGAVVGNIAEVGIGPQATSGSTLFSRELIRDADGDPTTITVTSSQTLRVHHRLRHYAPAGDTTGSLVANINGTPTELTYTRRAYRAGRADWWLPRRSAGQAQGGLMGGGDSAESVLLYSSAMVEANSSSSPTGTPMYSGARTPAAYTPGSFSRSSTQSFASGSETAMSNIRTLVFKASASSSVVNVDACAWFQVEFSPTFSKLSTDTLTVELRVGWGRYTES